MNKSECSECLERADGANPLKLSLPIMPLPGSQTGQVPWGRRHLAGLAVRQVYGAVNSFRSIDSPIFR